MDLQVNGDTLMAGAEAVQQVCGQDPNVYVGALKRGPLPMAKRLIVMASSMLTQQS